MKEAQEILKLAKQVLAFQYYIVSDDAYNADHDIDGDAEDVLRRFSVTDNEVWSDDKRGLERLRKILKKQGFSSTPVRRDDRGREERWLYSSTDAKQLLASEVDSKQIGNEVKRALPRKAQIRVTPKGVSVKIESEYPYLVLYPLEFLYRRGQWKANGEIVELDSGNISSVVNSVVKDYIKDFEKAEKKKLWYLKGKEIVFNGIQKELGPSWKAEFSNPSGTNQYWKRKIDILGVEGELVSEVMLTRNSGLRLAIRFNMREIIPFGEQLFNRTTNKDLFDDYAVIIADMKDVEKAIKDVAGTIKDYYKWLPKGYSKPVQEYLDKQTAEQRAEEEERQRQEEARQRKEARVLGLQKAAKKLSNEMKREFSDAIERIDVVPQSNGVYLNFVWTKFFKDTPVRGIATDSGVEVIYPQNKGQKEFKKDNAIDAYKVLKSNVVKWSANVRERLEKEESERRKKEEEEEARRKQGLSLQDVLDAMEGWAAGQFRDKEDPFINGNWVDYLVRTDFRDDDDYAEQAAQNWLNKKLRYQGWTDGKEVETSVEAEEKGWVTVSVSPKRR